LNITKLLAFSGGLITIAVSGLEGKVLMIRGAWLGVKFFSMPYGGFSKISCGAEELGACVIPETLPRSADGFKVLKIFTKPFSSM
jgi:hypothetical protein